jgi:ubiquinone/menaquinone biosynthesis C-methylase UbiE
MIEASENRGDYALAERLASNQVLGELDYRSVLLESMAVEPGHDVLDVACGNGAFTLEFKRLAADGRVAGLDGSDELIAAARRAAADAGLDIAFAVGDAQDLPYPAASFDRICCSYAIYHFPSVERALDEMFRVARPGTRIVLTGPTVANNRELYRLHELGGSRVRTTMGREVFQSAVDAYFARNEVRMKFTEYLNVVRFPSRDDFLGNYAVTKLFLDNVAPAERDTVLSRLRSMRWPSDLAPLSVTKTIGVFVAWT